MRVYLDIQEGPKQYLRIPILSFCVWRAVVRSGLAMRTKRNEKTEVNKIEFSLLVTVNYYLGLKCILIS